MTALLVALGGALGVLARYGVGLLSDSLWATLAVNVAGSFALGTLVHLGRELDPALRDAIAIGFLGGFTTFSTFSVQALLTVQAGRGAEAALYLLASVGLGLAAAAAGYALGQALG